MRTVEKLKGAERRAHNKLVAMDLHTLAEDRVDLKDPDVIHTTENKAAFRAMGRLNLALMRYDAAFHPHPEHFKRWAMTGACPYMQDYRATRMIEHFWPERSLYTPGRALSAVNLLKLVKKVKSLRRKARLVECPPARTLDAASASVLCFGCS
jgi:hypothetical protein